MTATPFRVVIPARYASTRFPGKALADLSGLPVVCHVWNRARQSAASEVVVATDDERIAAVVRAHGADVMMTSAAHQSGTDRVAEVARARRWGAGDLVVNCQGDVPLVPPGSIDEVAALLAANAGAAIATLCTPISDARDYLNPHVVKVIRDSTGRALYFSRAPIPAAGHGLPASGEIPRSHRHIGLYGYRVGALLRLSAEPRCYLEECEQLEQLRALWAGMEIRVAEARHSHGPDIDTPADLERAVQFLQRGAAA